MPFISRRKYGFARKKRGVYRRKRYTPRITRNYISRNKRVSYFKRVYTDTAVTISNTSGSGGISFSLDSLPDHTEFTNLYDQFRITGALIHFIPTITSSDINPSTTINMVGSFLTAIDHTDVTTGITKDEIMQYSTFHRNQVFKPFKRFIKVNTLDVDGSVRYKKWFSCNNPETEYFGLKYYHDGCTAGSFEIELYITLYFQCKSVI